MTKIMLKRPLSQHDQALFVDGPAGQLEAILTTPENPSRPIVGIICHPHPLHGGTMGNKVVTTLAHTFYELNIRSIRFNFRGVGESEGVYDHGKGEIEDLVSIMQWVKHRFPDHAIWLAGFSFGSYIAMQGALREKIEQLITIAPAVNHFDYQDSIHIKCPWILVMGEEDEVVPIQAVKTWVADLPVPIKTIYFPGVGHFFHGRLSALKDCLKEELYTN